MSERIEENTLLGTLTQTRECTITGDTRPIKARVGEPILGALLAHGIYATWTTEKYASPRGLYCGIGVCTDYIVTSTASRISAAA